MKIYKIIFYTIMIFCVASYCYVANVKGLQACNNNNFLCKNSTFHYLDGNFYEYYSIKNNSIMNLAPKIYLKGLDNRSLNFTINNLRVNGLNLPLNNFNMIPKYFLNSITSENYNNNNNNIIGNTFINYKIKNTEEFFAKNQTKGGFTYNTVFKTSNTFFNNTITQQHRFNNINLVLGINYKHLKHALNHNINGYPGSSMLNNWNSIIDFEYKPSGKEVAFRFTNLNYLNNEHKFLDNKEAQKYFKSDILKQYSIGNISILSYEDHPEGSPLWHYTSSLAISNQSLVINNNLKQFTEPQIYYENVAYKVQNISKTELLNNTFSLTYGFNFNQDVTKNHKYQEQFLWIKGKERTYQVYLTNQIDTFNFNRVFITPGIIYNHTTLMPKNFKQIKYITFTPSLDIDLIPINNIKIYGNYIYNTRIPHIYERYINSEYFYNDYFVKFLPNPNLKEEKSNKFTIGIKIDYDFYDVIKVYSNISAFYYKNHNYIDYNFLNTKEVTFSNIPKSLFRGYNIMIGCNIWNLYNQITYNAFQGTDLNGKPLNNIYPDYFILESCYKFQAINLTPTIRAQYFNSFSKFNSNYPYPKNKIPGYTLIDLYLKFHSSNDKIVLACGVENVFNKKYYLPFILSPYKDRRCFVNLTINL